MDRKVHTILAHPLFAIGLPHGSEWLFVLIFGFGGTILWITALIDCVANESPVGNTKVIWVLLILFLGFFGAIGYFLFRRPERIRESGR